MAALDEFIANNLSAPVQRKRKAPTVPHQVEDAIGEEDSCHHIPCLDSVEQYEETENFDPQRQAPVVFAFDLQSVTGRSLL